MKGVRKPNEFKIEKFIHYLIKNVLWGRENSEVIKMPTCAECGKKVGFFSAKTAVRICGLKPSHDSGVDVCPPCAQSASNKIA